MEQHLHSFVLPSLYSHLPYRTTFIAFPTTSWIYVYRDPVQVMKSHLKVKGTTQAVCLRSMRHPSRDITALARRISGVTDPNKLSTEKFCAAHLATLCEAAEEQVLDSNGVGRFVNYMELPRVLIDDIIPKHFLKSAAGLSSEEIARILEMNEKYSKGKGRDTQKWEGDSQEKEETAWDEMKEASAEYLLPVYTRMEAIRTRH